MCEPSFPLADLIDSKVEEISIRSPNDIPNELRGATKPFIIRGAVKDWPAVIQAKRSGNDFQKYLLEFDSGAAVTFFSGAPELKGRIYYNEDFSGLNCELRQTAFRDAVDEIFANTAKECMPLSYIGSTPIATHLPGFEKENHISVGGDDADTYIWIGGPSRISAHYDFSENLACVVAGRRQFILFPPDQLPNLYVGPLDYSPAGQPISLVNFHNPDFNKFPKFRHALQKALLAELEPGDAIFIPSMWWHHVEAFSPINVLVNYWWRCTPAFLGVPKDTLEHAIMTMRDLPAEQKAAWREIFNHYIFDVNEDVATHIPPNIRGILDPITQDEARRIRALLLNRLNA